MAIFSRTRYCGAAFEAIVSQTAFFGDHGRWRSGQAPVAVGKPLLLRAKGLAASSPTM